MRNALKNGALKIGKRGEMVVDVLIYCLVGTIALMTIIEFYNVFMKYQNLTFVTRRLVRAVEVTGTTAGLQTVFDELVDSTGLDGATFSVNAVYCDGVNRIQLRNTFTITVDYVYQLNVFTPDNAASVAIPIDMQTSMGGMSEVYTRP